MSELERSKWDRRYASGEYRSRTRAAPFLAEWLPRIGSGKALDVACGTGRNALFLAEAGFDVTAVDISQVAVDRGRAEADRRGLHPTWVVADLDDWRPEPGAFDVITVIRYRNPRLWPRLVSGLAPNGWVLVEHHLQTHLAVSGPSDEEFRLAPGELLEAFSELRVVFYSETIEPSDSGKDPYVIARLVACNGDPGW